MVDLFLEKGNVDDPREEVRGLFVQYGKGKKLLAWNSFLVTGTSRVCE